MDLKEYYSIGDLQAQTGISAIRIRTWEKRYNIFSPLRTGTNIRYYTHTDLKKMLLLKILTERGHRISELASYSHETLVQMAQQEQNDFFELPQVKPFIKCIRNFDEALFSKHFKELEEVFSFEQIMGSFVFPLLNNTASLWLTEDVSVCREQFLAHLARQKLIAETDKLRVMKKKGDSCLLFLPEGEQHELGLLYIQYKLRKHKRNSIYLGTGISYQAAIDIIEPLQPGYVIMNVTESNAASDMQINKFLSVLPRKTKLILVSYNGRVKNRKIINCYGYEEALNILNL